MVPVLVAKLARQDLMDILDDLNQRAGYIAANRYAGDFEAINRGLGEFPSSGSPRQGLGATARIKIVQPYIVVYDYDGFQLLGLRVLHGRRNITAKIIRRKP